MSVEQIGALPEFGVLTEAQKTFVLMLANGEEPKHAVLGCYEFDSVKAAHKAVTGIVRSPRVRAVLARVFPDPKATLLEELGRAFESRGTTDQQIEALVVKGVALGVLPPTFSLKDYVEALGR